VGAGVSPAEALSSVHPQTKTAAAMIRRQTMRLFVCIPIRLIDRRY